MSTITIKSDKPMVLIPIEDYESIKETMEILQTNPNIARELRKEHGRIEKGDYISFDEFKKKHDI
ncbi:MAG: hypothetical protein KAX20_01775 [Candidatus Omnitrophica bacterium]|nr:hypothetical protein [Candidatus Omnitrophota bacterium]